MIPPESGLQFNESNVDSGVGALSTTSVQFMQKSAPTSRLREVAVVSTKPTEKQGE